MEGWSRFADAVLGARRLGLAFVLLAVAGVALLPRLTFDFSPQTLFDATSEKARIYREHRARYGADDHHLMLMVEGSLDDPATWAVLQAAEEAVAAMPAVDWTQSPLSLPVPRSPAPGVVEIGPIVPAPPSTPAGAAAASEAARAQPLLTGTLVAADGSLACVLVKVGDDVAAMADVKPVVRAIEAAGHAAAAPHDGVRTWLLGPHAYRVTVVGVMVREELRFVPLTALVLGLVLFWLFRSPAGVLIPLLSVGLGALWTVAAMAATGQGINIINTITATLVLVIGVADAIHMMTRYGQERREGKDRADAVRQAVRSVGAACLLTSVTTAVGFATLLSARLEILRDFGLYAALGVMITFGFTIVFVPWALDRSPHEAVGRPRPGRLGAFLASQARLVQRRPRTVVAIGALVAAFFVAGLERATIDNFIMEYVPRGEPIHEAHRLLEDKLAGVVFVDVVLTSEPGAWTEPAMLARAAAVQDRIAADPGIQSAASVVSLLRELNHVHAGERAIPDTRAGIAQLLLLAEMSGEETMLGTHLDRDRSVLRITVRAADLGAKHYLSLEEQMQGWTAEALDGAEVPTTFVLAGTSQVGYAGIDSLIRDMLTSLAWAFALIFLTLAALFRSVRLAALAMVPNVLPIVVVLGSMGWAGRHLETLSAMVFSIGLGIAVDDTIHYLARYCAEVRAGLSPEEAVQRTTERTGRAIVHTSAVLVCGFGVLYTSAFPPNQLFAVLGSGVIVAALLADLWLLPALLLWVRPHVPGAPTPTATIPP